MEKPEPRAVVLNVAYHGLVSLSVALGYFVVLMAFVSEGLS
jgi:hypothetical protein